MPQFVTVEVTMSPLDEIESVLRGLLAAEVPMAQYVDALRRYKDAGGARETARAMVERMRNDECLSEREDALLDLLDIVEGFVSPGWRVW